MNEYIDIGANLTHKSFRSDRDDVLRRAHAAGVSHVVVTGTSVEGSQAAVQLARAAPEILTATVGVHPHSARNFQPRALATLRSLARDPVAVAIGECGLDYNRDFSPRPAQRQCFAAQLGLAAELGLPVFLHERDAHEDFVAILREHWSSLSRAVVHCFTGDAPTLDAYLELGTHIGLTGWICDERRGRHLIPLVHNIPAGRLMIETDAPFIVPRTMRARPRRNEPGFLPYVAGAVARATGKTATMVARETTDTARTFFGLGGT
jgi:TatD DNase family protein